MSLFASARERRVWFWTLARALRDSGLIEEAVLFSMLLVVATFVSQGIRHDRVRLRLVSRWASRPFTFDCSSG
jgi:hypothetical protein